MSECGNESIANVSETCVWNDVVCWLVKASLMERCRFVDGRRIEVLPLLLLLLLLLISLLMVLTLLTVLITV